MFLCDRKSWKPEEDGSSIRCCLRGAGKLLTSCDLSVNRGTYCTLVHYTMHMNTSTKQTNLLNSKGCFYLRKLKHMSVPQTPVRGKWTEGREGGGGDASMALFLIRVRAIDKCWETASLFYSVLLKRQCQAISTCPVEWRSLFHRGVSMALVWDLTPLLCRTESPEPLLTSSTLVWRPHGSTCTQTCICKMSTETECRHACMHT